MNNRISLSHLVLFVSVCLLCSCSQPTSVSELESMEGKWFKDGKPYTGEALLSSNREPGNLASMLLGLMKFGDSTIFQVENGITTKASSFYKGELHVVNEFVYDQKGVLINQKMYKAHDGLWNVIDLILELNYSNGLKDGICVKIANGERVETFYEEGNKIKENVYELSASIWGIDAFLKRVSHFQDNDLHGVQTIYYRKDTIVQKICTYRHGRLREKKEFSLNGVLLKHEIDRYPRAINKLEGEVITKRGDGTLSSLYKDGKKNGIQTAFYEDGSKKEETTFINDVKQGRNTSWYRNGEMEKQCSFDEGQLNGLAKSWYSSGDIWEEINYVKGKKHGLNRKWYTNGNQAVEIMYDNDSQHGLYKEWYTHGQLWKEKIHNRGRIVKEKRWYKDGKPAF